MGSQIDRTVMRTLRFHADAVMIGAGTLRAEKLTLSVPEHLARVRSSRGLNPQPLAVVLTDSGDLPLSENLIGYTPENLIVFASSKGAEKRLAKLSTLARLEVVAPGLSAKQPLAILKERYSVDVLLVEGGPTLNHALIREGFADELFLTLAPKLIGGTEPGAPPILAGPALSPQEHPEEGPRLRSIHLSGNELFLRYNL